VYIDTSAYTRVPRRGVSNGCLIGNGGANAPQKFWLFRPSGDNWDLIRSGSDLKNSLTDWFTQRYAEQVLCFNTGASENGNVEITDEIPIPPCNGKNTNFFVSADPVVSIDDVRLVVNGTEYDLPAGGYDYDATVVDGEYTGEIVLNEAPQRRSKIYVDYTMDALSAAFRDIVSDDVALVMLAGETDIDNLRRLVNHLDLACASWRFRIGVGMLEQGQDLTGDYLEYPSLLASENMILVSHNSEDDAAAGFAGYVSSLKPWQDP
ncbi:unnamed protein product, partial [marine sediment metagenome]